MKAPDEMPATTVLAGSTLYVASRSLPRPQAHRTTHAATNATARRAISACLPAPRR